jgi:hypothetical protein
MRAGKCPSTLAGNLAVVLLQKQPGPCSIQFRIAGGGGPGSPSRRVSMAAGFSTHLRLRLCHNDRTIAEYRGGYP